MDGEHHSPEETAPLEPGVLMDEVVFTDYGQLDLTWGDGDGFDGEAERFFAGQENGWVGAATGDGVYIVLARRSGGSRVRLVRLEEEPGLDGSWEDVVEVSVTVPEGAGAGWSTWAGETGGALDLPAGDLRMRVHANGRDAGAEDEFADGVVDEYLVQVWPAPPAKDRVVRTSSADAAYWNETWGGS